MIFFHSRPANFRVAAGCIAAALLISACGSRRQYEPSNSRISQSRRALPLSEWFAKQGLTPEELKTVDAVLNYIENSGGPRGDLAAVVRYAERRLDALSLDGERLTESAPLLALTAVAHMSLTGNSFTQEQIDELIATLPNLRTIVVDSKIICRNGLNPRVTCLK